MATLSADASATLGNENNVEEMSDYDIARALQYIGSPKRANEKWYVINQKWFDHAKRAYMDAVDQGISVATLSLHEEKTTSSAESKSQVTLEPIDNTDLFDEATSCHLPTGDGAMATWHAIKPSLVENVDYELLPAKIFKELVRRHGIVDETHCLERYTVETPSRSIYSGPDVKIDIYPIPCILFKCNPENGECIDDDGVSCIFVSVHDDLKVVTAKAKENIDTEAALKVRLWYRQKDSKQGEAQRQTTDVDATNSRSQWKKVTETKVLQNICEHVRTGDNPFLDDSQESSLEAPDAEYDSNVKSNKRSITIAYELMLECKDKGGSWARGPKEANAIITDVKAWRLNLKVGDRCDAMDSAKPNSKYTPQWFEGIVQEVDAAENKLLVHFHAWKPRFDEWIPRDSERLQPRFTKKRDWRSQLKVGEKVELNVYNSHNRQDEWINGKVLKIDRTVEGSERIYVEEKKKPKNSYTYSTYSRGKRRWISVWDEKLTEQNTHIKNEKKVEGDVSENAKQRNFFNHCLTHLYIFIEIVCGKLGTSD